MKRIETAYEGSELERRRQFFSSVAFGARYTHGTMRSLRKRYGVPTDFPPRLNSWGRSLLAHAYRLNDELSACAACDAHFSVGLLSTSLIEGLIQLYLVSNEPEVRKSKVFLRAQDQFRRKRNKRASFMAVVTSLEFETLVRIARGMGWLSKLSMDQEGIQIVAKYGYPSNLDGCFTFVRDCRNCVHPTSFQKLFVKLLSETNGDVEDDIDTLHYHFACVSLRLRDGLTNTFRASLTGSFHWA